MAAITAELDLEISKLRSKLGQANSRLAKFAEGAKKSGSRFGANFRSGVGQILKGGVAGLGLAGALGMAGAGALAGKTFMSSLKTAASNEQLEVSMEVLTGGADKARALIAQLRKDAAETPLQFEELGEAAKKLLAFGEAAESVPSTLRRIGDVSSAIGAPVGEIAEIYGKARVQGTLFAEDINQLTGRGIPVIQEFAKQLGVGESEVKKMGSQGKITFDMLSKAFVDLTSGGGLFAGMMAKQAGTLTGLWSSLQDGFEALRLEFGKPIADSLKPLLSDAIGLVEKMQAQAKKVGETLAGGIDFAVAALQELSGGEILSMVGNGLKLAFMEAVNWLGKGIQAVFKAANDAGFMSDLEARLKELAEGLRRAILSALGEAFLALKDVPGIGEHMERAANAITAELNGEKIAEGGRKNQVALAQEMLAGTGLTVVDDSKRDPAPKLKTSLGEQFSEYFAGASNLFETGKLKQALGGDLFSISVASSIGRMDKMAEKAFAETGSPAAAEGKKGPVSYVGTGGGMQDAVNSLFGRPMEASLVKIAADTAETNRILKEIRDQEPPKSRPVLGVAGFAPS